MPKPNVRNILIIVLLLLVVFHYENSRVSWVKRFALRENNSSYRQFSRMYFGKIKNEVEPPPWISQTEFEKRKMNFNDKFQLLNDQMDGILTLTAKVDQLQQKVSHLNLMLDLYKNSIPNVRVASSLGKTNIILETQITNEEKFRKISLVRLPSLCVGSLDGHSVKRSLLKIERLSDILPPNAKILSAVLHFKVVRGKDFNIPGGTLNFYPIKKNWVTNENTHSSIEGTTWDIAKTGVSWQNPGLWNPQREINEDIDVEKISASFKGILNPRLDEWTEIYFTEEGVAELQSILKGEPHNGWLLKMDREDVPASGMCFYYTENNGWPYIEIFYKLGM
jgi:hypothetical protein